ncbi:uncharacterized UDP-glucosyltransferase YdhE-like [Panonychus citri]|uniref:uncharacterized UDP-glucosyltransferase YdhE-like n=1 Tax=Panonychus citri TaxID=50023 RepID=UPI002307DF19|nr:uncharacterized UDP-glucosyltransferase YdhE-like [Panonychus citri]
MGDTQEKPLKVVITTMLGIGHLNACMGIGSLLSKRGHDVYFAHYSRFRSLIETNGMKFISLTDHQDEVHKIPEELPVNENFFKAMLDRAKTFSPLELVKDEKVSVFSGFITLLDASKGENYAMLNIIEEIKPDICLADYLWVMPWMVKANIPVVPIMSAAPNELYNGPPFMSGYSVNDPPELWEEYRNLAQKAGEEFVEKSKELFDYFGVDYVDKTHAKQLGIYIYPEPLDYKEFGPPKKNWIRLDSSIRLIESSEFKIPEKIADKPGKLIYVSMGTLASMVPEMMNMILEPLSSLPHRFIVSTGPNGEQVKLSDNMWGDKFINQVAILPHVDLFITHGGSNSLIEGLTAGKPFIVIPQFGDQLNNGQRVVDLKLGTKINLWEFSGDKLIKAIDYVLNNDEIQTNVKKVSEQLKKSDSSEKVCSAIETLARTKTSSV